jgi:CheY-like chemotaxis protein
MGRAGENGVVLLVEDDDAHAVLIRHSFEERRADTIVRHVSDGGEALDYLFHRGRYEAIAANPRPDLILIDLRLPKTDGFEVLEQVKQSEELQGIPVVVLSVSASVGDMRRAYRAHANSYLVKPVEEGRFRSMIGDLGFYWLGWNRHSMAPAPAGRG